jgi:hypothetical protein
MFYKTILYSKKGHCVHLKGCSVMEENWRRVLYSVRISWPHFTSWAPFYKNRSIAMGDFKNLKSVGVAMIM